ncbi:MAG: glycosyltransferase [Treponemataceae bacterium]
MRILYLVNALVYGGAELQTVALAVRMKRRGHDVALVSMTKPAALTDLLDKEGVEWKTLDMSRGVPSPRALAAYGRIVKAFKPDLVHTNLTHANIMGRVGRLIAPVGSLVSTIHSTRDRQKWAGTAYRLTDGLCDLTTGPSSAVAEAYVNRLSVPARKMRVVPNGIDCAALDAARGDPAVARQTLRAAQGVGEKTFVWIAAGRFMPAKDYPTLLNAFSGIVGSSSQLWIAGEGPLMEETKSAIREKGLDDRIKLLGLRKDLPALMAAADAFVLSSAWEGFGLVAAEALYAGLPVVSTHCGGVRDILFFDDARNDPGIALVPIRDPIALREAMVQLEFVARNSNVATQTAFAETRRKSVIKAFDLDAVATEWEQIYLQLAHL